MIYPSRFESSDPNLFFTYAPMADEIKYTSQSRLRGSHFILLGYCLEKKKLDIRFINCGQGEARIPYITDKTISAACNVFDVRAVQFSRVNENKTIDILLQNNVSSGKISELDRFKNSPFLLALEKNEFPLFETTMHIKQPSTCENYLLGLKEYLF